MARRRNKLRRLTRYWRQHTFLIFTSLVLDPSLWLAFFSIHLMSELTPPSASEEALLFSHPVTLSSTSPPLDALGRGSFIDTSPEAACLRIALRALPLSALPLALALDNREVRSLLGPAGGVDFPILPLPLTAVPMVRSPSRSVREPPGPPRRLAEGPRGAWRGLWLRGAMVAAGISRYLIQWLMCCWSVDC